MLRIFRDTRNVGQLDLKTGTYTAFDPRLDALLAIWKAKGVRTLAPVPGSEADREIYLSLSPGIIGLVIGELERRGYQVR